jgi:CheY-like chemotaxis protein
VSARRILVVDDSEFTCEAVAWALRGAGFIVDVARDLFELERSDLMEPDLVLMDFVLPEAFGDDVAINLRDVRGFGCPMLLFSSLPDHLLERRAADAALAGYISKRSGLAGIVTRARELLGVAHHDDVPAVGTSGRFEILARQRVRRVLHIAAKDEHWNASAIASEAHALAGDADLAGAPAIAEAARACRDVAQFRPSEGPKPEIRAAVTALAAEIPDARVSTGVLLVVITGAFYQEELLPELDSAGFTIVEAPSVVELRQKLPSTAYDLILVDQELATVDPAIMGELDKAAPTLVAILRDQPGEVDGRPVVSRRGGGKRVAEAIITLVERGVDARRR